MSAPASTESGLSHLPPVDGWQVPDEFRGVLEVDVFQKALKSSGLDEEDCVKISKALTSNFTGAGLAYKMLGDTSLQQQFESLSGLPSTVTAESVWDLGVQNTQLKLKLAAGFPPDSTIVETAHPYPTREDQWTKTYFFKGAESVTAWFSSKCCTYDSYSRMRLFAGGISRDVAGPGARVEVSAPSRDRISGTVVERSNGGSMWKVRLDCDKSDSSADSCPDASEAAVETTGWPSVGDVVEAKHVNGAWYGATIKAVQQGAVQWYDATRLPSIHMIAWHDGDIGDSEKTREELRPPGSGPLHPELEGECFAFCADEPKVAVVAYTSTGDCSPKAVKDDKEAAGAPAKPKVTRVEDEISRFSLVQDCPWTPISICSFKAAGPARDQGVDHGWFLDVTATLKGRSGKPLARILNGVGGVWFPASDGIIDDVTYSRLAPKLTDAVLRHPEELLQRLNDGLSKLEDVTLAFANSTSREPVLLLPEVHVNYTTDKVGRRVGSDVKVFASDSNQIHVGEFQSKSGLAQSGGVRTSWILDIRATRKANPGIDESVLAEEQLRENPNTLLALVGVTLVFRHPSPDKMCVFDLYGRSPWEKSQTMLGDSVDVVWETDGDGAEAPQQRWGVMLMLVPHYSVDGYSVEVPTCPQGHKLTDTICNGSLYCDECGDDEDDDELIEAGRQIHSCQDCDYVLCHDCYNARKKVSGLGGKAVPDDQLETFAVSYETATARAQGSCAAAKVKPDDWNEERIRNLCERHGWELSWMTEDDERRRRTNEQQIFFSDVQAAGGAPRAAANVAEKASQATAAVA